MKKIITFLGTTDYKETTYSYTDKTTGKSIKVKTRFVQEAIREIVGENSIIYIALTDRARETNWLGTDKRGLKSIFDEKGVKYIEIPLRDGKNEDEMWENFDSIFEVLSEEDDLYVDVTHSFRSIPIIVMSVLNYAKFIKNINIKAIYYGAFEAQEEGLTPIFDLSLFSTVTDWTVGAEKFINTGDGMRLSKMVRYVANPILYQTKGKNEEVKLANKISDNLKKFSDALYKARGNKISEYGCKLKESLELTKEIKENQLKPFEKILDKVFEKVSFYSGDIVKDIFGTVKLCRNFNLIQQAYTFLLENIINYICIASNIDLWDVEAREKISKLILYYSNRSTDEIPSECEDLNNKIKPFIDKDIANFYIELGDYRNDLNHAGYRSNARRVTTIYGDLDKFIDKFEQLIIGHNSSNNNLSTES